MLTARRQGQAESEVRGGLDVLKVIFIDHTFQPRRAETLVDLRCLLLGGFDKDLIRESQVSRFTDSCRFGWHLDLLITLSAPQKSRARTWDVLCGGLVISRNQRTP